MAANGSDGSITIDTRLDNKGFEKGSQELLNAIRSLTQEINQLGKILQSTFSNYGKSAEGADAKMRQTEGTIERVKVKAEDMNRAFRDTQGSIGNLGKDIGKLGKDIDGMSSLAEKAIGGDEKALGKFDEKAASAERTIEDLRARLEQFGQTRFETEDYQWLKEHIDQADHSLEQLLDRQEKMRAMGVKDSSKQWKSLQYDIDMTRQMLETYKAEKEQLEASGQSHIAGVDTEQFAQAEQAINGLEDKLQGLVSEVASATREPGRLARAFASVGRVIGGAVVGSIRALGSAAKTAFTHLAKLAGTAIKTGLSKIAQGAKKAASSLLGLGKSNKSLNGGLKTGFMTILKYGFGIRSLYFLFRKLRSAITEGFGYLAQVSPSVNQAISSMQSALGRLKNSLSTAFAPIVTAVAPAITYLINLLADAITYIGMFIAALTGQRTFMKATAVQKDYAASMADTAGAAGDAAKAIKEEKKQLAGFDELEILSDSGSDSSGSGGGGGGGGGTNPADMFEEVPIESGIMDFIGKIKEMFANGDYEGIGAVIAEGINKAFAKVKDLIEWDHVGGVITKYVNAFCRIFNSLVDNIDWDLIGSTFAAGINTLLHTIDLILTGIDWANLGAKLSEALNALVRDIDWELLGKTIGDYFSAKLLLITSAIKNFDWKNAGKQLAKGINSLVKTMQDTLDSINWYELGATFTEGINSLIEDVDWYTLGSTLGSSFNACLQSIYGVVHNFNWAGAGQALGKSVNGLSDKIDWATLGKTIGESLKGALTSLAKFIEEVDWKQLGKNVATCLANIDWSGVCSSLFEGLGAALGGLAAFIWGLIEDAWGSVVEWWEETAFEDGQFTMEGLLNGIWEGIKNIGTWIYENIFEPFIDGFKKAFGIASPSTVMEEQGGYIIAGLFEGLLNAIKNIGQWINDNILQPILNAFKEIGFAVEVGVQLIKDGWENLKAFVGDKVEAAVSLIKSGWTALSSWVGEKVSVGVGLLKDGWTALTSWIGEKVTVAVGLLKEGWTALSSWVGEKASVAISLIKSGWSTISSWIGTAVTVSISLAKKAWTTISAFVGTAVTVAISLAKKAWDTISNFVGTAVTVSISLAKKAWTKISEFVGTAVTVSISLAKKAWTTISAFVGTAVTASVSLAKKGWSTISAFVGTAVTATVSLAKKGWSTISAFVGTAVSAAVSLTKKGWTSISGFVGSAVSVGISLWRNGWKSIAGFVGTSVSVGISLFKSGWSSIKSFFGLSSGGIVGAKGGVKIFGSGGRISASGAAQFWRSVPHYAGGTSNAHGTAFVAGEHGPEVVGHIGGRTEVLNKSQLAATMYKAIADGMATVFNSYANALFNKLAACANGIISAVLYTMSAPVVIAPASIEGAGATLLADLDALAQRLTFTAPALATGTVMPYSVAKYRNDAEDITDAIEASNSDLSDILVQAIASAAQLVVAAVRDKNMSVNVDMDSITQHTIDDINRRTVMFQASPLKEG